MARRIIIAWVVTLVVLSVAWRVSIRRPIDVSIEEGGVRVTHRTVTEQVGPGGPLLAVTVEPPENVEVSVDFRLPSMNAFHEVQMARAGGAVFEARLPDYGKGARCTYAITVKTTNGVTVRMPDRRDRYYLIAFKGHPSPVVLIAHISCMFGSFFFMVLGFLGAVRILKGLEGKQGTVQAGRWVLFLSFVGTWPLGFLLNYQTFGMLWAGFPFGRDVTDNKTQLMFLLWLVSLLLVPGSLLGRGEEKDRVSAAAFAWAIVASFIVSLVLFVLPHSI